MKLTTLLVVALCVAAVMPLEQAAAENAPGTSFVYQGMLKRGSVPVAGAANFRFSLWDAESGGNPVGPEVTLDETVVSNGLFSVRLDFGANAFNGDARWLQIAVRDNPTVPTAKVSNPGQYVPLVPRQAITPTPYALALVGLRTMQNSTCHNIIGGFSGNEVSLEVVGATISGGGCAGAANVIAGDFATIGGGHGNTVEGDGGTIGGGHLNAALGETAAVGGGFDNVAGGLNSTIAGGESNTASGENATIGGGVENAAAGRNSTIAGGDLNIASGLNATIGGGVENQAVGLNSVVAGGDGNLASGAHAAIGGGLDNHALIGYSTVAGGWFNSATGLCAAVPGGYVNRAEGNYSFAAGYRAWVKPGHSGSFVFSDSKAPDFTSAGPNEFAVRATGGARFVTAIKNSPYFGADAAGVVLSPGGGAWETLSDRECKTGFAPADARAILKNVVSMPIQTWSYKAQDASIRHIGPVAQDFYAAFAVGESNTRISTVDADGVALAAIQGLHQIVQEKDTQIASLQAELGKVNERLARLERSSGGAANAGLLSGLGALVALAGVVAHRRLRKGGV